MKHHPLPSPRIAGKGLDLDLEVTMRRPFIVATTTAGAVLAAGLIAVPALAAANSPTGASAGGTGGTTCPCTGAGAHSGAGRGLQNGRGAGTGAGTGAGGGVGRRGKETSTLDPLAGLTQGTLTADQRQALAGMAEEEKLAHDVYVAVAAATKDTRFTRIAAAESRHLDEVRALLTRYGVNDPTSGKADGQFAAAAIQQQYRDFVARGSASPAEALAVGRDIENADLAALSAARSGVSASDVLTVYTRLGRGSQMHLRAFGG